MSDYDLLTMEQVAKKLEVSLKTVYRWIDSGELPVSLIGKRTYRIFERDLIKFIYDRQINKTGKKPAGKAGEI